MAIFERTYHIEKAPSPPMAWAEYEKLVGSEWEKLLASSESKNELALQTFLEKHPCLIPGAFSLSLESGHGPFPAAVISHPPLRGIINKIPDFLWIATDSGTLYPVLIEIETPNKRWFTAKGVSHSDLTQARDQLASWKQWFNVNENRAMFVKTYKLPTELQEKAFRPLYVLIHGSRDEFRDKPSLSAKREQLRTPDEHLMTFNRLAPNPKADQLMCVRLVESGTGSHFEAMTVPPTFTLGPVFSEDRSLIVDKEKAIKDNPLIESKRKEFLVRRVPYWDEWVRSGHRGVVHSGDSE